MGMDVMTSIDDRNYEYHDICGYQVKQTTSRLTYKAWWDPTGDFY